MISRIRILQIHLKKKIQRRIPIKQIAVLTIQKKTKRMTRTTNLISTMTRKTKNPLSIKA